MIRRDSSEAELDALQAVCDRLTGFDERFNAEWLDGAFSALMAGPSVPPGPQAVMPALLGDAWERTFADPSDVAQALVPLDARWRVLRSQLDPEALYDDPDTLQLAALPLAADDEGGFPLATDWAQGFLRVVDDPAWGWAESPDPEATAAMLGPVRALCLDPEALQAWTTEHYRGGDPPSREQLADDAAYAVQDLRLWWLDNAPRTAPRRVEASPGRNDPCHCGSGRKFKKCHGSA
jgi:uncharacterized protein